MTRSYYSSRTKPGTLTLDKLHWKFQNLYLRFRDVDYFREQTGITKTETPDSVQRDAAIALDFQPFPIDRWTNDQITEDHVFDMIEFLFDRTSKPIGDWESWVNHRGYETEGYARFEGPAGQEEFRNAANQFLADYKSGYELTQEGKILALGADGLQEILNAEIVPYDEVHVDSKVRDAIRKWRNRELSLDLKQDAIRELADVFEWLKKTKNLSAVLDHNDESALFNIANNFAIRHHNPSQKTNYDPLIWYPWIFHVYLATYHAAIHLLKREESKKKAKPQP
jgi:hypothetical protein